MSQALRDPQPIAGSGGGGGKGGGGSGGAAAKEDPNDLRSNAQARLFDLVSEGEIEGLVNGAQSILINGTPLQDSQGKYNFSGVAWDSRVGLPDQDYMQGMSGAESTSTVNVEVKYGIPIIRTLPGPIDAARITLSFPRLTYQDPKTGDLHGYTVDMTIRARPTGTTAWKVVTPVKFSGKTISPYERAIRIELGGGTDWEVQIARDTQDTPGANYQTNSWWSAVTLITDGKFQYPNSAYFGMTVDAKQFGSTIPTRSYDVKGVKLQLPSNYDPETRSYTGIWDGSFQFAWSDNPAWVLYDILTNPRYGLGNYLNAAQVDKWSLYNIAQYCDALVPDGFGGMEPRFRFNYQINAAANAFSIVQSIASSFRGLTFWSSGLVFVVADMPADPVKLIAPANVRDGIFTYEGTGLSARHSVAMVTWFDPDDQCRPAIELVEDPDLLALYGWRPVSVAAYGCTSRGQAHRLGKWALDTERYATETINFQAFWDQMDTVPGDIIAVYDPDYAGIRLGGRIASVTSNSVTLDAPLVVEFGKTYTVKLVLPDGALVSRVLTDGVGSTQTVHFATALATLPVAGALYGVSVSDLEPRQFRVLSIKEDSDGWFTVSAIQHDPTKYARVEQNIKLDPISYARDASARASPPVMLEVNEYLYRDGGQLRTGATLGWQAPQDETVVASYEVQRRKPDGNWSSLGIIAATSLDISDCGTGDWVFRVRAINYNGLPSRWTEKAVILFGIAAPPATVKNFVVHILGTSATLIWDANTDLDLSHYRIKFAPVTSGATWGEAIDLLPKISGISAQVPAMVGTYLIKAVDNTGTESTAAALAVSTVSQLNGFNAIATVSDAPGWAGTHDKTEEDAGELKLTKALAWGNLTDTWDAYGPWSSLTGEENLTGTYTFAAPYDLGAVYTSRLSASITAYGLELSNRWIDLGTWASIGKWSDVAPERWGVKIQLRWTPDDPTGTPVWSDWRDLVVGDYTARAFEFRLVLTAYDKNTIPVVSDASVSIDMPDRVEKGIALSAGTSGLTVSFVPPFRSTPAVGITAQNLATGDTFEFISGPSANGFTIKFFNAAHAGVARSFDYIAAGEGYAN